MTPEEALRRATAAERIFTDPLTQQTLDFMDKEIMEAWIACPIRDVEAREALWRMATTARKFRELLRGTMESGKLARQEINRKQTLLDKSKTVFNRFRR